MEIRLACVEDGIENYGFRKISSFIMDLISIKVFTLIFSLNNRPDFINSIIMEFDLNKLEIL